MSALNKKYTNTFLLKLLKHKMFDYPRHNKEYVCRWVHSGDLIYDLDVKSGKDVKRIYNSLIKLDIVEYKKSRNLNDYIFSFKSYEDLLFFKNVVITEKKQKYYFFGPTLIQELE